MDIKNKSFEHIVLIAMLFVSSCADSSSIEMRRLYGMNIPICYTEYYREELWGPVIGDGYKVVVYSLTDYGVSKIPEILDNKGFIPIQHPFRIQDRFLCQLQYEVREGSVLSEEKSGEIKVIIWDQINKKMIYILEFF